MATQITYDLDFVPTRDDVIHPRGDDVRLRFPHPFGASTAVQEVRLFIRRKSDSAVMTAITLEEDSGQIDLTTDNFCIIDILDTDTQGYGLVDYEYAVEMVNTAGIVVTPRYGDYSVFDDIVNDSASAAPLSRATRETQLGEIGDLWLANGYGTYLTVAAAATDTTITVADDTNLSASDDLYLTLDSGVIQTILAANVSSVTSNVITLSGDSVDGAASIGNVIRKGV